jgi:hypothetical protein
MLIAFNGEFNIGITGTNIFRAACFVRVLASRR